MNLNKQEILKYLMLYISGFAVKLKKLYIHCTYKWYKCTWNYIF